MFFVAYVIFIFHLRIYFVAFLVSVSICELTHFLSSTHYQTTNFRLCRTERVYRRQFQIWRKWKKVIQTGRKHWEKEKLVITSSFSFSHSVFKRLVSQGRQKVSLCGNGLIMTIFSSSHWLLPRIKNLETSGLSVTIVKTMVGGKCRRFIL